MVDQPSAPPDSGAEPADAAARPSLWQRVRLRAAKTVALGVLGLLALVVAIILGIDTGPGHRFVADQIAGIRFENGMRIIVGRIEGSLYGRMTLHDLSIRDTRGEFLFSPEVHVDWRPFAWLDNHIDVRRAAAQRVILYRTPQFRKTPPSEGPLLPDLDIDIGELRVDRFVAEAPVAGSRRVLTLTGRAHIADGRARIFASGEAVAPGSGQGGDRLALRLDAIPERNRLAMAVDLQAPQGGVIGGLAGLEKPLRMTLRGKGDWAAWDGRLDARLGGAPLADLSLSARNGTFAVKGPTQIARLFTGATAALLAPETRLDLTATLENRRATIAGRIGSDTFTLVPQGTVDLGRNRFDALRLAFTLDRPAALAPNLSGTGIRAEATLDGDFTAPTIGYRVAAARLVMNDMGLEQLVARGAARVDADHIQIPVAARVARITGLDTVAGGSLADVRLNGDLAVDGTRILSDNMRLHSPRLNAGLVLVADTASGLYSGAIDGRIDGYRLASVGIFTIATDLDLKSHDQGFTLQGVVRARSTRLLNDGLESYLGGNFAASAGLRYGPDGVVRFSDLRLTAPDLRVTGGRGLWAPDGRIALQATGESPRYGAIGVTVAGTLADPDARLTAQHPDMGIGLADLDARITGAPGGYRLDLAGNTDYGPIKADVTLAVGQRTVVSVNSADLSGIGFTGRLEQTDAGPFAGRLTASGNGLGGLLRLSGEGRFQAVAFNLRARDTVFQGAAQLAIGAAIIDGRAVLYDQPAIVADAQLADAHLGGFDLAAGRAQVNYRDGRGTARALVEGMGGVPFRLALNARLQPELWTVALRGRMRGQTVETANPARIVPVAGGYELKPTNLVLGGGKARLAGRYGPGIRLQSRLEGVDIALINAFVPGYGLGGSASGSLDFEQAGPAAFPRADARLTLAGFTRTSASTVSQPVDVNVIGKLLPDGGEARAVIRRRGSVIGRLVASLRPLPPGEGSWLTRLLGAPLGGGVRYNGPADTLFSFAGQAGQTLSGPIGLAADFSCRVSAPCLSGVVRGRDLTYENLAYGTRLNQLALNGRFSGSSLQITTLTARAGDGTVSASGSLGLSAEAGYPMDITAQLDKARLARSNALSATATGTLHLTKSAGEAALLSGDLRLPETRYRIVREGAAQVPQLAGVRFRPRRGPKRVTGDEQAESMGSLFGLIRLDLRLRAPEKLYVSGMGLDSEWSATFDLGGTSAAPLMTGKVELVRGNLGFASHSFELREGLITFTGGPAIDPVVAITATDQIEDVDVSVKVTGRAMNPQVGFSSSPSLPDDEVLSRILFGSSIANLSAIQAVQLAGSLNSLRGSGGGLNPLGKLRSAAGIDRLRILGPDEANGRGTALAAGQYLTDDIYVELITDARGFTATQLEVSITKWLSVLSQAGGSGVNSTSIRVRKNY